MKKFTLSMDEETLRAGREYARKHNISFNDLVRRLVEQAVPSTKGSWLDDTLSLMDTLNVSSKNVTWTRDELYRV